MEKLASQMLEKAKQFIEANPQIVKTTLLAGGLGALGGAMLPSSDDEDEPASSRVKRRLKNALLGATVAGGAGALLSNAAYNFGTAKLQRQLTPEEKWEKSLQSPFTLLSGTAIASGAGALKDYKDRQTKANKYIDSIRDAVKDENSRLIDKFKQEQKAAEEAIENLNKTRTALNGQAVDDQIKAIRAGLKEPELLSAPVKDLGVSSLRNWFTVPSAKKGEIFRKALGDVDNATAINAMRELNMSAAKANLLIPGAGKSSVMGRIGRNVLPRIKGNRLAIAGALGAPLALTLLGEAGSADE